MRKWIKNKVIVLFALIQLVASIAAADNTPITIDLRKGEIGIISVSDSPERFKSKLGLPNVEPYTGESEGQPYQAYRLKFGNGETINANQASLEINSKGFRTADGLGVGSTWKEFKKGFPDGDMSWLPDGRAIWSEKYKFRLYFKNYKQPVLADRVTKIQMNRPGIEPW